MRRAVLADTGPLYAAADPDDSHHKRAQHELRQLALEKREVIIAYSTLLEAYSLLLFRLGRNAALDWVDDLSSASFVNLTQEDYRSSIPMARRFADQPISLFDASLAALATRLNLPVWTYDRHFDVMRVRIWR